MTETNGTSGVVDDPSTAYPLLRLLRRYARPHAAYLGIGVLSQFAKRIPIHAPVFVVGLAYDAIFADRPYALPLVPAEWIPASDVGQIWFTVEVLTVLAVLFIAIRTVEEWVWEVFSERIKHDVRVDAYSEVQRLGLEFFDAERTGEIMSILSNDVDALGSFFTNGIKQTLQTLGFVAGAGLFMILLNWQLALVALTIGPMLTLANYRFAAVIERIHRNIRSNVGALNARLENNISGISVIKAYAAEPFESERVEEASLDNYQARWSAMRAGVRQNALMQTLSGVGLTVTFLLGGYWVLRGPPLFLSGEMTAGTLVPFMFYTSNLIGPLRGITGIIDNYKQGKAAAARIVGVQESDRRITEPPDAERLDDVAGRVEYDSVTFGYRASEDPVLREVSFAAEPGEIVGVVGPTGAGKSTLVKLLLRFYDVDSGTISIDGTDVRRLDLESLRSAIGYVGQEPFLFHGTVRENVTYGRRDVSDERVVAAARRAGADEFIRNLPDGYDTVVGERGVKLSGGQRQRVAIARAIVTDPPILVLDEATSHVDNETEVLIQSQLEELVAERTTFAIAHRLSTVRDADRILVVDDGEIVEHGTHEALLERDGLYATLWQVQVGQIESLPDAFVEQFS